MSRGLIRAEDEIKGILIYTNSRSVYKYEHDLYKEDIR